MKKALLVIAIVFLTLIMCATSFYFGGILGEGTGYERGHQSGDSIGYTRGMKAGLSIGIKKADSIAKAQATAKTIEQLQQEIEKKEQELIKSQMGQATSELKGSIEFTTKDIGGFYATKVVKVGSVSIRNASPKFTYKEIKIKVKFYNSDDTLLDAIEVMVPGTVIPGKALKYSVSYGRVPQTTKNAEVEIIEAKPVL